MLASVLLALGILRSSPRVPSEVAEAVLAKVRQRRAQWAGRIATIQGPQYAGVLERLGRPDLADKMRTALGDIDRNMGILLDELAEILGVEDDTP